MRRNYSRTARSSPTYSLFVYCYLHDPQGSCNYQWKLSLHSFTLQRQKAFRMFDNSGDSPECGRSMAPSNLTCTNPLLSPLFHYINYYSSTSFRQTLIRAMSDRCMKRSKLISRTKLLLEYQVVIGEILSLFQHLISCSFTSVDGCRVEHLLFKGVCHLWLHFHVSKLHGIPSDAGKFEKKTGIPIKSKHKLT